MDVAIFGGGPAGTAAALVLAGAGRQVSVFTRAANAEFLIGETLPPEVVSLLERLGVSAHFEGCSKTESLGILSGWGSAERGVQDFVFKAGVQGWHVDRKGLNDMLLGAAAQAGARVEVVSGNTHVDRDASGRWVTSGGSAGFLVDATGRTSTFTFPGSPSRCTVDSTMSLARHWQAGSGESSFDRWTLIEACAEGWCYSAPLPYGKVVSCFQADPDWVRSRHADWDTAWRALLKQLPETSRRFANALPASDWRVFSAASTTRSAFGAEGWIVAGDAANACDPLTGSGVLRALRDGMRAGHAIIGALEGDSEAMRVYQDAQADEWATYVSERRWYYSLESRWQDMPFWRRRAASRIRGL